MSVPIFFTKEDFYGRLLPGYATIILASYFFNFTRISNEISATVLFIIEGPVIGYIICSITSVIASYILSFARKDAKKDFDRKKYLKDYAKIRLKATERQINELDQALSTYQFCISTGSAFIVLSIVKIAEIGNLLEAKFPLVTLIGGLVLILIVENELDDYRNIYAVLHDEIIR